MDNSFDFNSLVGKTISSVEHIESERLPGLVRLSISFEDGHPWISRPLAATRADG